MGLPSGRMVEVRTLSSRIVEELRSGRAYHYFRGRSALFALLKALDVGPDDDVIIQGFTCLSVPLPILARGARPVYVDISPRSYCMAPDELARRVTPQTKAIVVQHTFGIPADMPEIVRIAEAHGIPIVEDCCHSVGTTHSGQEVGTFGTAAFFSYEWGKPLVIGLGGSAIAWDEGLREALKAGHPALPRPSRLKTAQIEVQYLAFRLLLTPSTYWPIRHWYHRLSSTALIAGTFESAELAGNRTAEHETAMAGVLERRLRRVLRRTAARIIAMRQAKAERYGEVLAASGLPCVIPAECTHPVYLRLPLLFENKERVMAAARRARIELSDIFASPVHPFTEEKWPLVGYERGMCPMAEEVSRRVVSLPIHSRVREHHMIAAVELLSRIGEPTDVEDLQRTARR